MIGKKTFTQIRSVAKSLEMKSNICEELNMGYFPWLVKALFLLQSIDSINQISEYIKNMILQVTMIQNYNYKRSLK